MMMSSPVRFAKWVATYLIMYGWSEVTWLLPPAKPGPRPVLMFSFIPYYHLRYLRYPGYPRKQVR
jgi:hypothetical protein